MRSVQVTRLDGPAGVEVVEAPEPRRGEDEVLVEVHALGMSWPDLLLSRGEYQLKPELPFQLGVDFAGVVREAPAGSGLRRRRPGRRRAAVRRRRPTWSRCTRDVGVPAARRGDLREGRRAADELPDRAVRARRPAARSARARRCWCTAPPAGSAPPPSRWPRGTAPAPIAVVSTQEKAEFVRSLGADEAVLVDGFLAAVKELTGGRGVDVVVDVVGGDLMTDSLRALGTAGPAAGGRVHRRQHPRGQGQPAAAQQHRRPRRRLGRLRDGPRRATCASSGTRCCR